MKDKIKMRKIKRNLGAIVILGMLAAIMLAQPVATVTVNPTNIVMQDDEWIGSSVSTEALIRFDLSTTPNQFEILQADVGIYDEDPDFRLEVAGSSGDGYFGVSTDDSTDGDIFIIDSSGNVGIGTTSPSTTLHVDGDVAFGDGSELTISSGVVTATDSYHTIDTESNAGSDELVTIGGGSVAGEILIFRADNSGRTIQVRETGNIKLTGNFDMDNAEDTLVLIFDGNNWLELSRSDNGV